MGEGGCDLMMLSSSIHSIQWLSGSSVSLEDQSSEINTAWEHLETIQCTLLLKTGLTDCKVRPGPFSVRLWVSRGMGTPNLPTCSTPSGTNRFSLHIVSIVHAVCLLPSCYARPSRSCRPPLLQPPVKEFTTTTDQVLQPPQTPGLTPGYQCLSCAGCTTPTAPHQCWGERKKSGPLA